MKKTIFITCPEAAVAPVIANKLLRNLVSFEMIMVNRLTIYASSPACRLGGGGGDSKEVYVEVRSDDPGDAIKVRSACEKIDVPGFGFHYVVDLIRVEHQSLTER